MPVPYNDIKYNFMNRFFLDNFSFQNEKLLISNKNIIHQINNVLRLKPNEQIICLDNSGFEFIVKLEAINKNEIQGKIIKKYKNQAEPEMEINVFQALPKQMNKFELIIQKGTELGVKKIIPLITRYTERFSFTNRDRLERIIKEAAEQSGRGVLPVLNEPIKFSDLILNLKSEQNLIAYEKEDKVYLKDFCQKLDYSRPINIFIGPEGGFSEEEITFAKQNNFQTFSLGKLILRTETAALAVVSRIIL